MKILCLLRVQFWAILADMFPVKEKSKLSQKKILSGLMFFALVISLVVYSYCYAIGYALSLVGGTKYMPSMAMAVASLVILCTTILKTKGVLFAFRDYDMVMSLPIPIHQIILSRLVLLYGMNLIFTLIIMLPMMVAYGVLSSPAIGFYLGTLLILWFLPIIPIVLASIIGTIVSMVAGRFRHKSLVTVILTLIFVGFVMGVSAFSSAEDEVIGDISIMIAKQIRKVYFMADWFHQGVVEYSIMHMLSFMVVSIVAFLFFAYILSKVFISINTRLTTGYSRGDYKVGQLKESSPLKSLYRKELKRYFSSANYVLNTAISVVMAFALVIGELVGDLSMPLQEIGHITRIFPLTLTFLTMMTSTTMASISIEGKNLWIVKSLPIETKDVFLAKLMVNWTVLAPILFCSIILWPLFNLNLIMGIIMIGNTILCGLFISVFGLVNNLKRPVFNWTSEAMVVKQSTASMITIFSGMGIALLQGALVMVFNNPFLGYGISFLALGLWTYRLWKKLFSWGVREFTNIAG